MAGARRNGRRDDGGADALASADRLLTRLAEILAWQAVRKAATPLKAQGEGATLTRKE